jgi:hypothetical protein
MRIERRSRGNFTDDSHMVDLRTTIPDLPIVSSDERNESSMG